ncbi:hypothetical protein [Geobacter sp. AOG1]|nr:hypothetical protein [Geobacter sp. AOG1]GFE57034.1 hypothetical protein AOG1_09130 [Geobacter sp. AOG1]
MSRTVVGVPGKGFDMAVDIVYYFPHPLTGEASHNREDLPT